MAWPSSSTAPAPPPIVTRSSRCPSPTPASSPPPQLGSADPDSVRLYALLDSGETMFMAELGRIDRAHNGGMERLGEEQAPVAPKQPIQLLLAFHQKGVLQNLASLTLEATKHDEEGGKSEEDEPQQEDKGSGEGKAEWVDDFMSENNYTLKLRCEEIESLVARIAEGSGDDINVGSSVRVSSQLTLVTSDFEGAMVSSHDVQMFVKSKLCPSLDDFHVKELIGKGVSCNACLCTCKYDNSVYVVKIMKIEEKEHQNGGEPREVAIFSTLRSPHVVKFLQAWEEREISVDYECSSLSSYSASSTQSQGGYVLIQMEFCKSTLKDHLLVERHTVDGRESWCLFKEITQGLKYIHEAGVVDRDLKPANIFVGQDDGMRIVDFGLSCFRPSHSAAFKATPDLGTPFYGALELKTGENIMKYVKS